MATVYLAEQEIFGRQVALKVMSSALSEDPLFGKRFMREAKIVSQLVHPNIVTVHDVGMHEGAFYLSMEYINGRDLKQVRSALSLKERVQVIRDTAKALEYTGSKGYVHRDIKPENIMLHSTDGRAVLMDFGIAKAAESDMAMTQTGTAIGTPHYMSPEQAKGLSVDGRSDLYSLGVVFFQLLCGRVPFDAESAVAIGIKHITEEVPLLPLAMEGFQPIIDIMLAKNPGDRYQSASELIYELAGLDMDTLAHVYSLANNDEAMPCEAVADNPTVSSGYSQIRSTQRMSGVSTPTEAYTVFYDDESGANKRRFSWFFILLVLGVGAGVVLYFQRPELVVPLVVKAKVLFFELFERYKAFIGELSFG